MPRDPWVSYRRSTNDEIEAEIQKFKENGGEIIVIPDNFDTRPTKTESGVKLGKVYRQLREIKEKK